MGPRAKELEQAEVKYYLQANTVVAKPTCIHSKIKALRLSKKK